MIAPKGELGSIYCQAPSSDFIPTEGALATEKAPVIASFLQCILGPLVCALGYRHLSLSLCGGSLGFTALGHAALLCGASFVKDAD